MRELKRILKRHGYSDTATKKILRFYGTERDVSKKTFLVLAIADALVCSLLTLAILGKI